MKFSRLFMITLFASNASLLCMDGPKGVDANADDALNKHYEDAFNRHKDYDRFDGPEYAERPTESKESLEAQLTQLRVQDFKMWEETESLITKINEEDFGQPAVALATSDLPASSENDAEDIAALRFRKDFEGLCDADQKRAFANLKGHKRISKQHAQAPLGNVDAKSVAAIWQMLAVVDCGQRADTCPVRSLLIRHGVRVAQNTESEEINSFFSPAVLSLFGEELAGNIRRIFVRVHQINTDCRIDENPDTENAAILLAFPLIKKECTQMFKLQTQLRGALKGTKPDLDYTRIKEAQREAQARREALIDRLLVDTFGELPHNAESECHAQ